jgi:TolA-binding protein
VKLEDADCTTKALEKLVAYYPKPDYWKDLLYTLQQDRSQTQSDKNTLQLFRLMSEVDVLARADDYTEMAQLAMEQGSPGEAQHILEKGFQKGIFTDKRTQDKNQRLLDQAKKAAAADQATLPKIEKDADAAPTGDKDVGVGLAYLGYQQYDKASDLLSKGLTKGGVKSDAEAHLLLGIAQLKAGHKDDAVKSFHAVKGDPALERLANLWTLHAKQA